MAGELIEAIGHYIYLSPEDKELVHQLFQKTTLEKDERWLNEGEICRQLAFVEQGLLRFYINEDGREITHFFAGEGNFACNYESFLKHSPSRKNIQAVEKTTLWTISQQNLEIFYQKTGEGEKFGRLLMEAELLNTIDRFLEHYTYSPEQRYQQFLSQYGGLLQRIPQYYVASYVGVQPQSLSRIRKRMAAC
ncbi:MAG: Crp/Fnr family transcriptional regulator [Chitinophagaceae bacterium]